MSLPARHLGWSIVKNIGGQSVGRLVLTIARFVIAAIIVKVAGKDAFGEYMLVLSLLLIGEWLADFGLTDICVRAICRDPSSEPRQLAALGLAKAVQGLCACLILGGVVLAMGYSQQIMISVGVGCAGILCYAAAQVYRAHFKARMFMERDVAAEMVGVMVMAPLTYVACRQGMSLPWLVGCHAISRVVFLCCMYLFTRGQVRVASGGGTGAAARAAFLIAAPLGLSGLCAAVYDQLDPIMLHKMLGDDGPGAVAHYSGAMRFVWPVTVIVQAIAGSVFPILAASWGTNDHRFRLVFQRSMDLSVFVAAGAVASVYGGSEALIGIFGHEMSEAAEVLRLLVWAVFARAINNALIASFIVAGGVKFAFIVAILGVATKFTALWFLIPTMGAKGAAYADVACEWLTGVVPVLLITQRLIGFRVQWIILAKVGAAVAAAIALAELAGVRGGWVGLGIALVVYPSVAMGLGAISLRELRMLGGSVKGRFAARKDGSCPACGTDLPGVAMETACPECGRMLAVPPVVTEAPKERTP